MLRLENRLNRVGEVCSELETNIMHSIHDQGAGELQMLQKKLVEPFEGSIIDIDKIVGDKTMTPFGLGF